MTEYPPLKNAKELLFCTYVIAINYLALHEIRSLTDLKSIFHCDTKLLVLGTFASPNAKDSIFASPNAKNTNMLVSFALGDTNFLRRPCTFPVEYRLRWAPDANLLRWACTFHVVYVNFFCVRHPMQTCF